MKDKELNIDDLKSSWQNQNLNSIPYSKDELSLMLNRKSVNNVKCILIFSILEFVLLTGSLLFTSSNSKIISKLDPKAYGTYTGNYHISVIANTINLIVSIIFIYYFYVYYKKIRTELPIKELINNILNFRKCVNYFLIINISLGLISFFMTGFYQFVSDFQEGINSRIPIPANFDKIHIPSESPKYIFWFIFICSLLFILILVYYFFVYGIFLIKLKKYLNELKKIT